MTDSRRVRIIKNLSKRRRRDVFPLYHYVRDELHYAQSDWLDRLFREGQTWLK